MRARDLVALEFPRVRARLADFAASEAAKAACRALEPTADRSLAEQAIECTWQSLRLLDREGGSPMRAFPDVRPHLRRAARPGFVLEGKALVEVRTVLGITRTVGAFLRRHSPDYPALADLSVQLQPFPMLEAALTRALDEDGGVLDEASDELAAIRAEMRRLRETVTRRLGDLVARKSMADVIADTYVTLRNDRYVVPVRASAGARLSGVVQDRSVSGETLFVEPLFAVDLNNQLLIAVREEEAITRRILADLTALVRTEHDAIGGSAAALIAADCLLARAKFGRAYGCTRPAFSTGAVQLREARHPGLLFSGRPVTPVDLHLPADRQVLVITGPNTGGKTVALKTLGLCALMAQSGLLVPAAEGAEIPCVPAVFTDIGDDQNIERNLSTFSAHIANLCEILAANASGSLVLLDEPGVGTDPEEGAALAIGLIEQLERLQMRVALSTHYTPVKLFALGRERCSLAAVDFDDETLTPRFRLVYHSLGRSLALPIAQRLGLPEPVLVAARASQSEQSHSFNEALDKLEGTRRQLEEQLAAATSRATTLATQQAESERILTELRERRRTAWGAELREAREFLRQLKAEGRARLKELQRAADERALFHRYIREQEETIAARATTATPVGQSELTPGALQKGDPVEVGDRGLRGELLSIEGAKAWIQRGTMRFEVPATQLRRAGKPTAAPPASRVHVAAPSEEPVGEINVIGFRARDAVAELEPFLDRAVRARQPSVRILHGVGSGALRRAIHEYLAGSPYCSGFRSGEASEGGDGVTVAVVNV